MKTKERAFLKCTGTKEEKKKLRKDFQKQQWLFDRQLKQCKNTFDREQEGMLNSRL